MKLLDARFGNHNLLISDQWDSPNDIGLQKKNKLIYVAYYNKNDYFYECELLTDDPEISFPQGGDNSTEEQLLEVIKNFFDIEQINR